MPLWYLGMLADALPLLQAEETINAITVARAAQLEQNEYRRLINRLNNMAAPYEPEQPIRMAETPEEKAAARAFFSASGIKFED